MHEREFHLPGRSGTGVADRDLRVSAYLRPSTLIEALTELGARPYTVLAGGTDILSTEAAAVGWGKPGISSNTPIMDISALGDLDGIRSFPDRVEIGALVTWAEIIKSDLPAWFDGMRQAGQRVGGRQIQNRGTLAGNLCNASPAADGVPALLALNARVRLQCRDGSRELAVDEFILGNRRTCLKPGELLSDIILPVPGPGACATFLKLGARNYLVISIAMVSVCLEVIDGRINDPRIAVGACSEVARRLAGLEARLQDALVADACGLVQEEDFASLTPIDDIRAPGWYRRHGARILVERAIESLLHPGAES